MAIRCNDQQLPITLYFSDAYGKQYPIVRAWNRMEQLDETSFVQLRENMGVQLAFFADDTTHFDEESIVMIEVTEQHNETHRTIALTTTSVEQPFCQGGETYPWRMGYYVITFRYQGRTYYSGISVVPLHFTSEQLQHVHTYLERKINGILYGTHHSRYFSTNTAAHWCVSYAKELERQHEQILYTITQMQHTPHYALVHTYEKSAERGRSDRKSLQKEAMQAGMVRRKPYINKIKGTTTDTLENQWMKRVFVQWNQELFHVATELQKQGEQQLYFIVEVIRTRIQHVLREGFLQDVSIGNRKPILKKRTYVQIHDVYEKLKSVYNQRADACTVVTVQRFKKTYKLYEYYCLFVLLDGLMKRGFSLENQILPKKNVPLPSGSCFVLKKGIQEIKVWYDTEVVTSEKEARHRGDTLYCLSGYRRPDIRMDVYENTIYKETIVYDAKFRKFSNIRGDEQPSDTERQLFSYWQFVHIQSVRPTVSRVICLYAGDDRCDDVQTHHTITYVKVFPNIQTGETIGEKEAVHFVL